MKVTRTDLHRCYSPISFTVIRTADERHPELMFRHPENEYDWLSSDAAVDEVLLINEYTFTEAGLRAG
ncbi:hypothetical protein ACLHZA_17880 [Escherichia coli]